MRDLTDDPAREVLGALVARLLLDQLVDLAQAAYDDLPEVEREALRAAYAEALRSDPRVPRPRTAQAAKAQEATVHGRGRQSTAAGLTRREQEVLALVAEGRSNGEIGRRLVISTKTVSVHVSHLLTKLGAASRTEAVAIARRVGLLAD